MKIYKIILLLMFAWQMQAQEPLQNSSFLGRTEFKIGYYGTLLIDNGINIGAEYLWKEKRRVKQKKNGERVNTHQLLLNSSIGYSTNFSLDTDDGLTTHLGLIWRRTSFRRWQFNVAINPLGYHRAFLPETYEVQEGVVAEVDNPGRSYYAPSFEIGIGRLKKRQTRKGWYLNMNIAFRTPHNAGYLPVLSFQYGQRFNFKKK